MYLLTDSWPVLPLSIWFGFVVESSATCSTRGGKPERGPIRSAAQWPALCDCAQLTSSRWALRLFLVVVERVYPSGIDVVDDLNGSAGGSIR